MQLALKGVSGSPHPQHAVKHGTDVIGPHGGSGKEISGDDLVDKAPHHREDQYGQNFSAPDADLVNERNNSQ